MGFSGSSSRRVGKVAGRAPRYASDDRRPLPCAALIRLPPTDFPVLAVLTTLNLLQREWRETSGPGVDRLQGARGESRKSLWGAALRSETRSIANGPHETALHKASTHLLLTLGSY
ncbi:hypothetical protein KC345_g115 [Hortaea werneckii]|nr:hypothetical protein KC345_g115 [Hortaea werneckii]